MGGGETSRYYEMDSRHSDIDFSELTKIMYNIIQNLEPENVGKIIGCILLQEPSHQEMYQLAFGPDSALISKIAECKATLGIHSPRTAATSSLPIQPITDHQFPASFPGSRPFSSPPTFHPYWDPQVGASDHHPPLQNMDFSPGEDYPFRNHSQFLNLDEQIDPSNLMGSYYCHDGGILPLRMSRRSPSMPEFPIKPCHYFYKGYCKHGANCRYFHGQSVPDGYSSPVFNANVNDAGNEDHGFSPGSLEKLEMEITELLRSRRGSPVSIASLPMLYYEKYGRNLQAEGYLTESQRHGKAGFSLTKLLARLKNSIRLVDKPHGQHAVILAEDAARYMECRNERNDPGAIVASSHQIYLTFPAESTFTEDDVSNYFMQYGPVRDVRIPSQEKRMFGFVSFVYSDTVNTILVKKNPHFICGARVLVKPYREKSRIIENRTYMEKMKPTSLYCPFYLEMDTELHGMSREAESSRLLKKHVIEEQEKMLEHERRRLLELNMAQKPLNQQPYFGYSADDFKHPEGAGEFQIMDHFSYTLDALNNGATNDDKTRQASTSYSDQESNQIELPESPFASPPIGSSISAVI